MNERLAQAALARWRKWERQAVPGSEAQLKLADCIYDMEEAVNGKPMGSEPEGKRDEVGNDTRGDGRADDNDGGA